MESGIKSSFIPRDASVPTPVRGVTTTSLSDLLILLGIVFLVASIALAAGVFLYLQYLQTSSSSKRDQLERARAAFEPALIQELTRLDDRMQAADVILRGHIAPSIFFHLLEQLTLQTVSYQTLEFAAPDDQNMEVSFTGVAVSVNSIALQADYLGKSGIITSPIFSNIGRQPNGVRFDLEAKINPLALRYANLAASLQPVVNQQQPTPQQQQQPSPFEPTGGVQQNTPQPPSGSGQQQQATQQQSAPQQTQTPPAGEPLAPPEEGETD